MPLSTRLYPDESKLSNWVVGQLGGYGFNQNSSRPSSNLSSHLLCDSVGSINQVPSQPIGLEKYGRGAFLISR